MSFGVVAKVETGSRIKIKHPNSAGRCLRQKDVLRLTLPALLVMLRGWGWADFVPPRLPLPRGARISASASSQPPAAVLAGSAAPCHVPAPGASWAGRTAAGWVCSPGHPHPSWSPVPRPGIPARAALPTPGCRHRLLLSRWQRRGRLALININTASAAPSPSF